VFFSIAPFYWKPTWILKVRTGGQEKAKSQSEENFEPSEGEIEEIENSQA
jgi:hypothetical protein